VSELRGHVVDRLDLAVVPTLHPAAVLRTREGREQRRAQLVEDLTVAARLLAVDDAG
jgi:hypothetical protein